MKKRPAIYFFSLLLTVVLISPALLAQTSTGKVTGKITDGSTNQPLTGVSILIKGTKQGVASITDGTYILSARPGTYTLVFSFTGFKTKEIDGVVVKDKESSFLDIIMETASKEMAQVVVTSSVRRESASSVYSAQRRSAAVSDGISAESIRKLPDNDGAAILKRVTGVNVQDNRFVVVRGLGEQYNQTMINGVPVTSTETGRNAFAFDLIPAAAVDNITINKTATPDMPGNFAGGIVQVNTRDFPASDFYSITLQAGYSDETYGNNFLGDKRGKYEWLSFGGKTRALPDNFPGPTNRVPFTDLNEQEKYRHLRTLNNNLAPVNHGKSGLNENFQLGFGKTIHLKDGTQFGIVAALNQRKTELIQEEISAKAPNWNTTPGEPIIKQLDYYSENTRYNYSVDFGGVLNFAYRFGNNKITLKNLYTRIFSNSFIYRPIVLVEGTTIADDQIEVGLSHFVEEKSILNSVLGGEHRTGKNNETRMDWNLAITANQTNQPDTRNFILRTDTTTSAKPADWIFTGDENVSLDASLEKNSRLWSLGNDIVYGGAFNIATPFNLFGNKQLFKSGILFQNRRREVTGMVLPIQGLNNTLDSLLAPSQFYPGGASSVTSTADFVTKGGNYNAGSSMLAIYESLENKFGEKWRVIWGLRIENYQQHVNVYKPVYFDNFQDPDLSTYLFASRNTFNFLPSVNLVFSPVPSVNIRAGYSNTVIRPELKDIAAFARFDFQTLQATQGNPELRSTTIQNYDLKLEWFPSAGEIISVAAFYKDMLDPVEYARTKPVSSRIPLNVGDAYVRGVEAEFRKKLDFFAFAPWLENVTIYGNGALLKSKVSTKPINSLLYDSIMEHKLTGQPDYIINAGINITALKRSFDFTLSYNRTGDNITELGRFESITLSTGKRVPNIPHYWIKARDALDLVVSQSFLKGKLRLKATVTNLLKTGTIIYQDLDGDGRFGTPVIVKKTFPALGYISGTDATPSDIKPQRNFSFSVTYTF
jgi:hypothetical protein